MPPPRLSRHLRPCHLPVTAKQVRCVHTTGRAKLSTTGYDTTPQTPSAKGSNGEGNVSSNATDCKNNILAEDKSWWKKVLGRVASLRRHGNQFESIESTSGPSPERLGIDLHKTREASGPENQHPTQSAAGSTTSQQDEETQQGQLRLGDRRKDDIAPSEQANMVAIQQQINQLSEQLRVLEARLEGGSPTGQSPSTSSEVSHTLAMRSDPTQFNVDNQDQAYLLPTPSHILLSTRKHSEKVQQTWLKAHSAYVRSVYFCGITTATLVGQPTHVVARIGPPMLRRFRTIRRIALMDDDIRVSNVLVKFRSLIDQLESILRESSIPVPSINDPRVIEEAAQYSKVSFYTNPLSHTLDGARKRYRKSCLTTIQLGKQLPRFKSPAVKPIARRNFKQLRTIGAYASKKGDRMLMDAMEFYLSKRRGSKRSVRTECSAAVQKSVDTHEKNVQDDVDENEDDVPEPTRSVQTPPLSMNSSTDLRTNSKGKSAETPVAEQRPSVEDSTSSNRLSHVEASTTTRTTKSPRPPPRTDEVSEQSLLEELFPETASVPQPQLTKKIRDQYPRLKLPQSPVRPVYSERPRTLAQQAAESIQQHGEQIAVLQLTNCSTGLTVADFRRIIPKGKHLEGWRRDSDFYKVIPGRDPLSLQRLPFYYLLFKSTEAALSYQKNASRLHKLSARYQPSSILSAIPPPKGFLEDGEDIAAAVASYNLLPKSHSLSINMLMQPYNPALRQLIEQGGYQPIATSDEDKGKKICRVLLHIEGYEPSASDLFLIITRDAYRQGMQHPLCNESQTSIHRLRDVINLKMSTKAVSSSRPRPYGTFDHSRSPHANSTSSSELTYDDPEIQSMMGGIEEDRSQAQMNQEVMNRVYNRWVLDFVDEDAARRWSLRWHRRILPDVAGREVAWKDTEEARICNTEVLW